MISLYRKYRPQKFAEMAGQDHIRQTLTNVLAQGKVGHAYLFAGPRGTGKTTAARLLAKAINCGLRDDPTANNPTSNSQQSNNQQGSGFEPCNACNSCKEIQAGRSFDTFEIDAASNRGIDEIRELREKIKFKPSSSKYKVFIIDEAHMLTKEAFNALLKTLEEPPAHAIFVLATTEVHKLPITILSRVQRFDFHRAEKKDLMNYLERIVKEEKIKISSLAIELIAELGDGSFRDSVSLLEQLAHSESKSNEITLESAQKILGITSQVEVEKIIQAVFGNKQKEALAIIEKLHTNGHNLEYFIEAIIGELRSKYLFTDSNPRKISLIIQVFLRAREEIKASPIPQLPLEMAIIKLTDPDFSQPKIIISKNISDPSPVIETSEKPEEKKDISRQIKETDDKTWQNLLQAIKPYNHSLGGLLKESQPMGIEGDEFKLRVGFKFHQERLLDLKNRAVIEKILRELTGQNLRLSCLIDQGIIKRRQEEANTREDQLINSAMEIFDIEE